MSVTTTEISRHSDVSRQPAKPSKGAGPDQLPDDNQDDAENDNGEAGGGGHFVLWTEGGHSLKLTAKPPPICHLAAYIRDELICTSAARQA
jgi:hypothetical protein